MSLGHRPSKKTIEAVKLGLSGGIETDKGKALEIYRDFRWQLKIMEDRTYQAVEALIDLTIVRCQAELTTPEVRDPVVQRFSEMRSRTSEFTVKPDDTETDQDPG